MEWVEWALNGARDLVLLLAGGGIALLSGTAAAKATANVEREKRSATDAVERRQAVQRQARSALNLVYDVEALVYDFEPRRPSSKVKLPPEMMYAFRKIADVIPDATVRSSVDHFLAGFHAWGLITEWTDAGPEVETTARAFQLRLMTELRSVLAAAARGEAPDPEATRYLEMVAALKASAWESYWEQLAPDTRDAGHTA